jgi:hypothetical protein
MNTGNFNNKKKEKILGIKLNLELFGVLINGTKN